MRIHRLRGLLTSLALLPLLWLAGCNKSKAEGNPLTFISVSPTSVALFPGRTAQVTVTAHYADGSTAPATSGVTYTASAPSVASIDSHGLVTAVGAGTGTISAAIGDKSADAVISVAPATFPVFTDGYAKGVSFVAFGGSTNTLSVDPTEHHSGTAALKIAVPATGYTGGALNAATPQNLSLYNALTFWAKASKTATLNVAGFGNDALGGPSFSAELANLAVTTTWTKFILPIPVPSKLTTDVGLFHFAEGADEGAYTLWLDDVQYENLEAGQLSAPASAAIAWTPFTVEIGKTQALSAAATVTYTTPAVELSAVSLRYFDLTSSAPAIASIDSAGLVSGLALGTSDLTAKLGSLSVPGSGTVTVITPVVPTTAPPRPTVDPSKVISLLSKAYTNVPVDTWGTSWSNGNAGPNLTELTIGGDDVKKYTKLQYVGVEFFASGNAIDATSMTYLHLDIWTPDITDFHVKLVDFGANAVYGGGDDSEAEVAINSTSMPQLTGSKQWVSLDIPMANFGGLASRKHLSQLIFVGATPWGQGTVYVDNIYFHNSPFVDSTPPTVAITDNVAADVANGPVTFTFPFSEDVGTSFTDADVTVTGGTAGTLSKTSATVYTLEVTPPATSAGTIQVSVPAGAFQDLANNANTAGATASQAYDTHVVVTPMDLPIVTFDSNTVAYGLLGFEGAQGSTITTDPAGGTNKVAKVVKVQSAMAWAGTTLTADGTAGFAHRVPFDGVNNRMTVRVYSPDAGVPVRLKVENHADGTVFCEADAVTTVANAWETLIFDFGATAATPANPAKSYDKVSIFFNFGYGASGWLGSLTADKTYYFDDVAFARFTTITFDNPTTAYTLLGFEGAQDSTVAADPSGASNKVVKVVKVQTAMAWAGTTVSLGAADSTVAPIPLSAATPRMLVRVYSPDAGVPVRLKVENHANGAVFCEADAVTTVANAWETLVFDFGPTAATPADGTKTYDKLSIFFNFGYGNSGWLGSLTADKTYYFDDITFDALTSPVTFDSSLEAYTLPPFEGSAATLELDPAGAGNQTLKVVKPAAAMAWAGVTVSTGANGTIGQVAFGPTRTTLTVRIYSPAAGIPVRMKVENAAVGTVFAEADAVTTTSNAWETLTFNFGAGAATPADPAKLYNKLSLFPNFGYGTSGWLGGQASDLTFYFDDLVFLP